MSNSRSPRAVRSMTMGTSGMARTIAERGGGPARFVDGVRPARGRGAGTRDRAPRARLGGDARARPGAEPPEQALRAALDAPAVQPQRVRDLRGRSAVDEHREQREIVPIHEV